MQIVRERRLRPAHTRDIEGALQLVEWPVAGERRYDVLWVQTGADGEQQETRLTREPLDQRGAEQVFDEAWAHRRAAGDVAIDGDEAEAFPVERMPPPLPPPPPAGSPAARSSRAQLPDPPQLDMRPLWFVIGFFVVILGVFYAAAK
jgi:hypothetical protein